MSVRPTNIQTVVLYTVVGAICGLLTNMINKTIIKTKFPKPSPVTVLLKTLVCGFTLLTIQSYNRDFAYDWQSTTPGLFFVSVFFGLQTDLMADITALEQR